MNDNKVLMILGMHRSGTSLLAHWLQKCGLFIGDDLLEGNIGNEEGHFEDKRFFRLHIYQLREGLNFYRHFSRKKFKTESQKIINDNNEKYEQWGWKEPRTCLLLDHWHKLLPNAKAIIIFRHYTEVIDSMQRRHRKIPIKRKIYGYHGFLHGSVIKKTLKEWIRYNKAILTYLEKKQNSEYIIINLDHWAEYEPYIFNYLVEVMNFNLYHFPLNQLYRPSLLQKQTIVIPTKYQKLIDEAESVYQTLQLKCKEKIHN